MRVRIPCRLLWRAASRMRRAHAPNFIANARLFQSARETSFRYWTVRVRISHRARKQGSSRRSRIPIALGRGRRYHPNCDSPCVPTTKQHLAGRGAVGQPASLGRRSIAGSNPAALTIVLPAWRTEEIQQTGHVRGVLVVAVSLGIVHGTLPTGYPRGFPPLTAR